MLAPPGGIFSVASSAGEAPRWVPPQQAEGDLRLEAEPSSSRSPRRRRQDWRSCLPWWR